MSADSTLTTPAAPDFGVALSPASLTIPRGQSGTFTVTLSAQNGFAVAVSLSSSVAPALKGSLSLGATSVTPPGTTTLRVSVSRRASPGSYTLTVTGTGGGLTHSAAATVVAQ